MTRCEWPCRLLFWSAIRLRAVARVRILETQKVTRERSRERTSRGKRPYLLLLAGFWVCLAPVFPLVPDLDAQTTVSVEASPQLFTVMCALHAAGYEAEVSSAGFHPLRAQLRAELLGLRGPATEALRKFYRDHELGDPAATLSRYISFALVVGPPPKFEFTMRREELPPDALSLEGFNEILADFHREAQVERLWSRVQPVYDREVRQLHQPMAQIVLTSTGYLREVYRPTRGRAFSVYVEPMVGGKTNFRSYADRYTIVLSPGAETSLEDVRHAYLHFLLDPLAYRYRKEVASRSALHRYTGRAPRLAPEFRDDFPALLTECLVRAVELRLRRLPVTKAAAAIDEAEGEGYILVRAFYRGLETFEKAEPAMAFYFPDLVNQIDVAAEARRLDQVQFAAAPGADAPATRQKKEESELDVWLREGEQQVAAQKAAAAAASFEKVLEKYPGESRAEYGLAVALVLQGQGEKAKEIFQRIVARGARVPTTASAGSQAGADPMVLAWSHVYLGRIQDLKGNRELALSEYRAALAVESAPEPARTAARRGIEKEFEPPRPSQEAGEKRP